MLLSPTEINSLTLVRKQNTRHLRHEGGVVIVVVVVGHAILR
jgi:hypothetical protein